MLNFKEQFTSYVEELIKWDPNYAIFGSGSHEYKFAPKLSESDIEAFEKKYGCKLPETYKTYLVEFGNGGAGPSYGIFALGNMDGESWPDYIDPSNSFRFTEAHNNEDMIYVGEPKEEEFEDEKTYFAAHNLWYDEVGHLNQAQYYVEHGLDQGAIPICHHGCALRSWLVVDKNSPEFGNVWNSYLADNGGVEPELDGDGKRVKFADWILDWCAKSILELESKTNE